MQRWKPVTAAAVLVLVASACTTVVRDSVASDGTPANAPSKQVTAQDISDDGRYVIFVSSATNLVPGDTNGDQDVFRHDNQTGATIRVSVSPTGGQIPADSTDLAISGDGDHVAFRTKASLVAADDNGADDVYVRTISTGTTEWVSVRDDGKPIVDPGTSEGIQSASISDDGHRVLIVQSVPGSGAVYLHDRSTGTTELDVGNPYLAVLAGDGNSFVETAICSADSCDDLSWVEVFSINTRVQLDTQCGFKVYDVSSDGLWVLGDRYVDSPTTGCTGPLGLVRWSRTNRTFTSVPLTPGLVPMASISNDGRFVATNGTDLRPRVVDLTTGVVQAANADGTGHQDGGVGFGGSVSGNGYYVAFSSSSQLVSGDTDTNDDVYTRFTMQPGVTGFLPSSVPRGSSFRAVTLSGTELLPGLSVSVSGSGVTVNSMSQLTPTKVTIYVSVDANAPVGPRDVTVDNRSGFGHSNGMCSGCLSVS
jgi:hypothetical protein